MIFIDLIFQDSVFQPEIFNDGVFPSDELPLFFYLLTESGDFLITEDNNRIAI